MLFSASIRNQNNMISYYNNNQSVEMQGSQSKELGLEKHRTVIARDSSQGAENDVRKKSLQFEDLNKNSIYNKKELPSMVEAERKLKTNNNTDGLSNAENSDNSHESSCQCETCQRRRYQDGSDDTGVSFQNPTKIQQSAVASRVRAHEMEHVRREQMKAEKEGLKVISQSVSIETAVCPECGKTYVSGGKTRTVTRPDLTDFRKLFAVGSDEKLKKEFDSIA